MGRNPAGSQGHKLWQGVHQNSDPHDLPAGMMQEQTNLVVRATGKLEARGGVRPGQFLNKSTFVESPVRYMLHYHTPGLDWVVYQLEDGKVRTGKSFDHTVPNTEADRGAPTLVAMNPASVITGCKDPLGHLVIVNGIERGIFWDGLTAAGQPLGLTAPTVAPTVTTAAGGGATAGDYQCYYRWLDKYDKPTSLSPAFEVTATKDQKFSWSGIANATEARIVKKQLWRTIAGGTNVVYFVTEINNNTTTTFTNDTLSDDDLVDAAVADPNLRMTIVSVDDGSLIANRFVPPPSNKKVVVWYQDRAFYLADSEYSTGLVSVTAGSPTVSGSGTNWNSGMIGQFLYVAADARSYEITAASGTSLTLAEDYAGTTQSGASYVITVGAAERNLIYFSEANEIESVPATNTVRAQQFTTVDDDVVGGMPHAGYLYVLMQSHILRLDYVKQPKIDLSLSLAVQRGCFHQRAWDYAEDIAYLMDSEGIYAFDGTAVQDIGQPINNLWRDGTIDFTRTEKFHVRASPQEELVRFFVCYPADEKYPGRAWCYHYRLKTWHLEEYYQEMGAACVYPIDGRRRLLLGGVDDTIHLANQGTTDGVDSETEIGTVFGTVDSAQQNSLTDNEATFTTRMVDVPVSIVSGTGKGQTRIIESIAGKTLSLKANWITIPDTTSGYRIGAIEWSLKTGLVKLSLQRNRGVKQAPEDMPRAIRVVWEPVGADTTFDIRRYMNHNADPETNRVHFDHDGLLVEPGETSAIQDMRRNRTTVTGVNIEAAGFTRFQFDGGSEDYSVVDRWIAAYLTGFQCLNRVTFYELEIQGGE